MVANSFVEKGPRGHRMLHAAAAAAAAAVLLLLLLLQQQQEGYYIMSRAVLQGFLCKYFYK